MYSNEPIVYKKERRQKTDFICTWLEIAGFLVWIVLFAVVLLFENAQPRDKMFFDRLFAVELAEAWDYSKVNLVMYLLLFLFGYSTVSLILNFKRLKRSTDHIRISFILSIVCSCAGLVFLLIRF